MIHQIWFKPENNFLFKKFDERAKNLMSSIEQQCYENSIDYKLWTEEDLEEFNLSHLYNTMKNALLSDIVRCYILTKYGGMYIDSDIEILDFKGLITHLNNSKLNIQTHHELKYTNHIISVNKDYNFDKFLDSYIGHGLGVKYFSKFAETEDVKEIPLKYIKDHSFHSWRSIRDII